MNRNATNYWMLAAEPWNRLVIFIEHAAPKTTVRGELLCVVNLSSERSFKVLLSHRIDCGASPLDNFDRLYTCHAVVV